MCHCQYKQCPYEPHLTWEEIDRNTAAYLAWAAYDDRLAHNAMTHLASFKTRESARQYKAAFPEYEVRYMVNPGYYTV